MNNREQLFQLIENLYLELMQVQFDEDEKIDKRIICLRDNLEDILKEPDINLLSQNQSFFELLEDVIDHLESKHPSLIVKAGEIFNKLSLSGI